MISVKLLLVLFLKKCVVPLDYFSPCLNISYNSADLRHLIQRQKFIVGIFSDLEIVFSFSHYFFLLRFCQNYSNT